MLKLGLKMIGVFTALTFAGVTASAMEVGDLGQPQTQTQTSTKYASVTQSGLNSAKMCAIELMPEARHIYTAVSPKVMADSNLRKLVKKDVRPKVFSGKLSIKAARKNAQEASVCLSLLKLESSEIN